MINCNTLVAVDPGLSTGLAWLEGRELRVRTLYEWPACAARLGLAVTDRDVVVEGYATTSASARHTAGRRSPSVEIIGALHYMRFCEQVRSVRELPRTCKRAGAHYLQLLAERGEVLPAHYSNEHEKDALHLLGYAMRHVMAARTQAAAA